MRQAPHRGLSLLEVILAIAILGGSLATIGQLIRIGARNAAEARDLTMAQLYAESQMNRLSSGAARVSDSGRRYVCHARHAGRSEHQRRLWRSPPHEVLVAREVVELDEVLARA